MQATEEGYRGAKLQNVKFFHGTNFVTKLHPQKSKAKPACEIPEAEKGLREVQEKPSENRKGTERSPRKIELCDILQLCAGGEAGGHHTEVSFPEQQKIDLNFLNN